MRLNARLAVLVGVLVVVVGTAGAAHLATTVFDAERVTVGSGEVVDSNHTVKEYVVTFDSGTATEVTVTIGNHGSSEQLFDVDVALKQGQDTKATGSDSLAVEADRSREVTVALNTSVDLTAFNNVEVTAVEA